MLKVRWILAHCVIAVKHTSGEFMRKSDSDLRHAQAIARRDQDGHALGTAMFLAQQCVEKSLKSMFLRLGEIIDLPRTPDITLKTLGHSIYRDAYKIYSGYVEAHKFPHIPQAIGIPDNINKVVLDALASNKSIFSKADEFWTKYSNKPDVWGTLAWKNSLGALSDIERRKLMSFYDYFIPYFTLHAGQIATPSSYPKKRIKHSMHKAVFNNQLLKDVLDDHSSFVIYSNQRTMADHTFRRHKEFLTTQTRDLLLTAITKSQYSVCAKRIFLEYWFSVFNYFVLTYVELFPHSTHGRYPSRIGDKTTTAIYESQSEHVLFSLFVDIPYHVDQLRYQSAYIEDLRHMVDENTRE